MEIMITLRKIRDKSPCESGWKKVLLANNIDMETPFPLKSIIKSNSLNDCLWALKCLPEYDNLLRLYAVWCAKQVRHLMNNERSANAINVAERYANGLATDEELANAANAAAYAAYAANAANAANATANAANATAYAADAAYAAAYAANATANAADAANAAYAAARDAQSEKLIEILTAGKWVD